MDWTILATFSSYKIVAFTIGLPDNLPSIEDLLGKDVDGGKQYTILGCSVTMSTDECKYTFKPSDECKNSISANALFEKWFQFCYFTTSRELRVFDGQVTNLRNWFSQNRCTIF